MAKVSAGILLYKFNNQQELNLFSSSDNKAELLVFLVHPGGPFFKNKDNGWWSIPKGEQADETLLKTAIRELKEEVSIQLDSNADFIELGSVKQKSGKEVYAWAYKYNGDVKVDLINNTATIEWPPKSGKQIVIPENDKGEFFNIETAKIKINQAQAELIDRLLEKINKNPL